MTEWIPVEERLPEKEGSYLIRRVINDDAFIDVENFYEGNFKISDRVTHWAPLPEMPKKKRWMPKKGELVYGIKSTGKVLSGPWADIDVDNEARNLFGIYKTRDEAEQMLEKIKKFVESEIGEA